MDFKPIGIIHTAFKEADDTPIQPKAGKGIKGTVEVFPEFVDGLADLDGFSHIILISHFHLSNKYKLKVVPFMDDVEHGVFATRTPSRPNPIGISVVKLDKIDYNILHIENIDIIDGTPLLDIKPYLPDFDSEIEFRKGWLETNISKLYSTKDDGRFKK
jgi:tRNA-Thr(GGU) m(6)t(6)A37 methyltransferase TsaA